MKLILAQGISCSPGIFHIYNLHFLELSRDGYEKLWGSQQVFCKPDKLSSVVSKLCFYKECNKNIPRPRLTVHHVNNHRGGVAAAGRAGVVTGVLVSRLGHYQSTLCPLVSCQNYRSVVYQHQLGGLTSNYLRSFLILQTDSTSSTVKVESSA